MTMPTATYRLQFRDGMTFDRAIELVPYWQALGISHLYASPIFTAVSGSTHGYDLTRYDEIEPALGGLAGLERLGERLKEAGLGLILDVVPNHMAASMENPWWRSVAEWGEASPYARHFDIDWTRRLTLPVLGRPLEETLTAGEITLDFDEPTGTIVAAYFDHRIPLRPETYAMVLGRSEEPDLRDAGARAGGARAEDADTLRKRMRALDPALSEALQRVSGDKVLLERVLEAQPWRLQFWQEARKDLSYRRFFEVTGLVGVRVEAPPVFDDAHRLVLDLVRRGVVDGLRIDHVDGLADPTAYLEQLRAAAGPDVYIVVEKILASGERLPESWPVAGTTGYEFIAAVAELGIDGDKAEALDRAYAQMLPQPPGTAAEERKAKAFIVHNRLETELNALAALAEKAAAQAFDRDLLRQAIAAVAIAFPVYRTYSGVAGLIEQDRTVLDTVRQRLAEAPEKADSRTTDTVLSLLSTAHEEGTPAREFTTRFQQMTGPVMAKAVEDTLFYRFNRLIALNEVGGDPAGTEGSVERFHHEMRRRLDEQPYGLIASTTHDTKRGEDARARLYAISERPEDWADAVTRWREMNRGAVRRLAGGPAPEPETEWLLYQALAGAWPDGLAPDDAKGLETLKERFLPYIEKALREAKLRTDWLAVDEEYEGAVKAYAAHLLAPQNRKFLDDFHDAIGPIIEAGRHNSLVQTLMKLTAPGIPDIYQGAEGFDVSLADPDNRRPPDFAELEQALKGRTESPASVKIGMIAQVLALRRRAPDLFTTGDYLPLDAEGPAAQHVVSFLRRDGERAALIAAFRLPVSLKSTAADAVDRTQLLLPSSCKGRQWHDVLAGSSAAVNDAPSIGVLLAGRPAAVFLTND